MDLKRWYGFIWYNQGESPRNNGYIYLGDTDYFTTLSNTWSKYSGVGHAAKYPEQLVIPVEFVSYNQNLRKD